MSADLEHYFAKWNLRSDGAPQRTPSGWMAFVRRHDAPCVLKVPKVADEINSWLVLDACGGTGAVRLLEHDMSGAQLLERAAPGTHLTDWVAEGRDDEATAIICDVVKKLHLASPPKGLPSIERLGTGFDRYLTFETQLIPSATLSRAKKIFDELSRTQAPPVLLHGDLHHDNILFDEQRGWLAIDPKGYLGEREYEFGAMLLNPTIDPSLFADASISEVRVESISKRLGLNAKRILAWAFAQAILSAIWSIEDGEDPTRGIATAEAVLPLL